MARKNKPPDATIDSFIHKPIEFGHPVDVAFGAKKLSTKQKNILDKLPDYSSQVIVGKRDVSMLDLSTLTAKTGDEFAMFTKGSRRLIVRGNRKGIPLSIDEINDLRISGYRWSGHTHPGSGRASLIASEGDIDALINFYQKSSAIYNSVGRYQIFSLEENICINK